MMVLFFPVGFALGQVVPVEPPVDVKPMVSPDGKEAVPVRSADEPPVYPGGDAGLTKEIGRRLKYPKEALEAGIQGKVMLQYVVAVDGRITDIKVVRGVFPPMDKAAVEAVRSIPPYERPAHIGGQPVPYQVTLPVMFQTNF